MKKDASSRPMSRIEAEIARERHDRQHNDEVRSREAVGDDFRLKDARENDNTAELRRPRGR